jgi:hypothetical protein
MMPMTARAASEAVQLASAPANAFFYAYFSVLDSAMPAFAPFKSVTRAQGEALKFMSRQAQAYLDYSSKLATCRNPQDVLYETKRFCDGTAEQALDTTQRMIEAWQPVTVKPVVSVAAEKPAKVAAPVHDYVQLPTQRRVRQPRPAADYLPVEREYSHGAHA